MRTGTVTVELHCKGDRVWSYKGNGTVAEDETLPKPFLGQIRFRSASTRATGWTPAATSQCWTDGR